MGWILPICSTDISTFLCLMACPANASSSFTAGRACSVGGSLLEPEECAGTSGMNQWDPTHCYGYGNKYALLFGKHLNNKGEFWFLFVFNQVEIHPAASMYPLIYPVILSIKPLQTRCCLPNDEGLSNFCLVTTAKPGEATWKQQRHFWQLGHDRE